MEKLLPQNVEAECAVLGSILIDPDAVESPVVAKLQPRNFYRDAHRSIYEAVVALQAARTPVDFITICEQLERQEQLADVGGASYITSLINQVPTSGNVEYYADIVAKSSHLRDVIHMSGQIAAEAWESGADAEAVIARAQRVFSEIGQRAQHGNGLIATAAVMPERLKRYEYLYAHRGTIIGVPTGFTDLDKMTGGLQKSDLIVLAARPGEGKTSLAMNIARNAALKHDQHVAVFSLEMSKEQLSDRLVSTEAGIDQQRLRTGWIEEDEWEPLVTASERIADAPLWIDDTAGITPADLRNKARRLQVEHGLDLIIVDYLQLMRPGTDRKYENRVAEITEISRTLKEIARELNVPVLALSQMSRAVESRRDHVPQLSDLRESGSIEQDADIVMFIHREEPEPGAMASNVVTVIVAKHRNGPVGEVPLYWNPSQTSFRDLERTSCEEEEDIA